MKKSVLKDFAHFTGKHVLWFLFNKVTGLLASNFIKKETPTLIFSCENLEIFKSTYFEVETLENEIYSCLKSYTLYSSSHQRCSIRIGDLRNFAKFTGKHLCQSLFFNKVADLRPLAQCFPVIFAKFLRILFLQNTPWLLLLTLLEKI